MIIVSSLIAVACLLNPYFEEGALFPLVLFRKLSVDEAFYSARVDEFTSPIVLFNQVGLRSIHLDAAAILWLLTLISFFWLAKLHRLSIFRLLLFVAFSYLGLKMIRNLSPAAVVCGIVLCENLTEITLLRPSITEPKSPSNRTNHSKSTTNGTAPGQRQPAVAISVVLFGLAASHFSGHWGRFTGLGDHFSLDEAKAWYCHDAALFSGQHGFPNRAIVASFGQAAVYEFHNGPTQRVLMDGRLEVCTRETFELYESILLKISQNDPTWQQLPGVADAHGQMPTVILDSRSSRNEINGMFRLPNWRLVFADSAAAVFIPKELADQLALPPVAPTGLMKPPG